MQDIHLIFKSHLVLLLAFYYLSTFELCITYYDKYWLIRVWLKKFGNKDHFWSRDIC